MTEPWDRLPNERSKAYYLFCQYRDTGPLRSLAKLRRTIGKPLGYQRNLEAFSAGHNWQERVQAFDDHLATIKQEENKQAIIEMNRRQAQQALSLQEQSFAGMDLDDIESLTPKEKLERFKVAVEIERKARAADVARIELSGEVRTGGDSENERTRARIATALEQLRVGSRSGAEITTESESDSESDESMEDQD